MRISTEKEKRIQVKVDSYLKNDVDSILSKLGINQTTLINALYKRVAASGSIPFELKLTERELLTNNLLKVTDQIPVRDLTRNDTDLKAWFDEE
ncbi:type II toxin-antitoxin system RelB/DinJ family antitoxin [Holzapfeliella sp. JNUCC 80]